MPKARTPKTKIAELSISVSFAETKLQDQKLGERSDKTPWIQTLVGKRHMAADRKEVVGGDREINTIG